MVARIGVAGLVLLTLAYTQSTCADTSSNYTRSQTVTSILQNTEQNEGYRESTASSTYLPSTISSATFSSEAIKTVWMTVTQDATSESQPRKTDLASLVPTESPREYDVLPAQSKETGSLIFASTDGAQSTYIPLAQETSRTPLSPVTSKTTTEPSPVTQPGNVEIAQTMRTQSDLKSSTPQSSNHTQSPTATNLLVESPPTQTGVIYAPHVGHLASTREGPQPGQATPSHDFPGSGQPHTALLPISFYEGIQSASVHVDTTSGMQRYPSMSSANSPASAYHGEPAKALPTTLITAAPSATMETGPALFHATTHSGGVMSEAVQLAAVTKTRSSAALVSSSSLGSSTAISTDSSLSAQPTTTEVPATYSALIYDGQTLHLDGMTLAAEPTSTAGYPDGKNQKSQATSQSQAGLVASAAVMARGNIGMPSLMVAIAALVLM